MLFQLRADFEIAYEDVTFEDLHIGDVIMTSSSTLAAVTSFHHRLVASEQLVITVSTGQIFHPESPSEPVRRVVNYDETA